MQRERILFVELWRLGDAVSATAGLRALRQALPNAEIGVVAHSVHGDPLLRSSDADVKLPFDAFWTRGKLPRDKYLPWTINYGTIGAAIARIGRFSPDRVLLFRGDIREQLFFSMIVPGGVSDLEGRHSLLPGVRKYVRPAGVPRWKEYVSHVQQWTGTSSDATPHIEGVSAVTNGSYILVHPGASWRFKQWSAAKVVRLIRRLRELSYAVRLVAGPEDHRFVEDMAREAGEDFEVEYPSLEGLYSRIRGADAVICNNSAALHIAEAVGTPCIALTGPSDPVRWGTYRSHSRTIVRSTHLACHPCGEKRCVRPERPCIDEIELVDVLQALSDVIAGGSASV
jgi:ADP-heptose:LPS heptosyltransferase